MCCRQTACPLVPKDVRLRLLKQKEGDDSGSDDESSVGGSHSAVELPRGTLSRHCI